jgi:hypothetical protein
MEIQLRFQTRLGLEKSILSVQRPLGMVVPVADSTDYQDSPHSGGGDPPLRGKL